VSRGSKCSHEHALTSCGSNDEPAQTRHKKINPRGNRVETIAGCLVEALHREEFEADNLVGSISLPL